MNLLSQETNEDFWELLPDDNFISVGKAIIRGEGSIYQNNHFHRPTCCKSEKRENPPSYVKS